MSGSTRLSSEPVRLRPWHLLRVPAPPAKTEVLTSHRPRTTRRRTVAAADPLSGAGHEVAVWEYAPQLRDEPSPEDDIAVEPATLVFVHGFRGDHHGLALLADCLPEHRILSVDLPGFGASPAYPHAEHTVDHHAQTLGQVRQALELDERTGLVAHSYGTIVAAALCASRPQAWSFLALLNPIAEPALSASSTWLDRASALLAQGYYEAAARLPARLSDALLRSSLITWATTVFMSRTDDARVLAYTHDQHRRHFSGFASPAQVAQSYRASTTGSVPDSAAGLSLPVLLLAGDEDPLGSPAAQRALAADVAAASPRCRLVLLPGVGHLLHYERPRECASLIRDFLSRARPRPGANARARRSGRA